MKEKQKINKQRVGTMRNSSAGQTLSEEEIKKMAMAPKKNLLPYVKVFA